MSEKMAHSSAYTELFHLYKVPKQSNKEHMAWRYTQIQENSK